VKFIRTIKPAESESPLGHLVRLTEANRLRSPLELLRQAQPYPRNRILAGLIDMDSLATANGVATEDFGDPFAPFRRGGSRVSAKMTALCNVLVPNCAVKGIEESEFCAACVGESGLISAAWHLSNYTCCPRHGTTGEVQCTSCGKSATWIRPGLLTCSCGGSLASRSVRSPAESEMYVCDLIDRAFSSRAKIQKIAGFPSELGDLSLADLLVTVRFLALYSRPSGHAAAGTFDRVAPRMTNVGAEAFSNWPHGFRKALQTIETARGLPIHVGIARRIWIYERLGYERIKRPEFEFLRNEIDRFIDKPIKRRYRSFKGNIYFNVDEAAKDLEIDYRTLLLACDKGRIRSRKVTCDGVNGFEIDVEAVPDSLRVAGKSLEARKAARMLQIPPRLMMHASRLGLLERSHRGSQFRESGWSEEDIISFRARLDSTHGHPRLVRDKRKSERLVHLTEVLRKSRLTLEYRYFLLEEYLGGRLAIATSRGGFSGVLVPARISTLLAQTAWCE